MDNLTLYFDEYIRECEFSLKLRPETIRGYKNVFTMFRKYMPGITLDTISPNAMTELFRILETRDREVGRDKVIKTGIKQSTVATYRAKLNGFFEWLKNREYIASNPFDGMKYVRPMYEDLRWLSKEEVEKIMSAIVGMKYSNPFLLRRNVLIMYILLFCGLRRGELVGLQLRDIDLERKMLVVRGETSKSKMDRVIPMNNTLCDHLNRYLGGRKKLNLKNPYLLVSDHLDMGLGVSGLKHLVLVLRKKTGVTFHLHRMRHTFAVNFIRQNPDIHKLRQLMGHKDIRMTSMYLRCLPLSEMRGNVECLSIDNLM